MLSKLSSESEIDIRVVINTLEMDEDIITSCDKLVTSLKNAEANGICLPNQLIKMKI